MDIVTTHEIQNLIGRIVIAAVCSILSWYIAFRQTPELDGVKNACLYRTSYGMMVLRGMGFIAFTIFNLFPME